MPKQENHIVPELSAPVRLQEYGVGIFEAAFTKSALKKTLKKEYITVNGAVATSATYINGGETIKLKIPEKVSTRKELIFPLKVLFEDDYLALVHKPAGIMVSGNSFKTIANALPQNLKQSALPDVATPQPVHRLDYGTTGILLAGKTSSCIRALNKKFEAKEIKKSYYAVAIGMMNSQGTIDTKIDFREAQTDYRVMETVPSEKYGALNLVKLYPKTGRRHQIRKHLSGMRNPILGDKEYGVEGLIQKGRGIYLHAYSIEFVHPFTKDKIRFSDPLPEKFAKIFPVLPGSCAHAHDANPLTSG